MKPSDAANQGACKSCAGELTASPSTLGETDGETRSAVSPLLVWIVLVVSCLYTSVGVIVWGIPALWAPAVGNNASEIGPELVEVGVVISTSSNNGNTRVLEGGFSSPEPDGTWISSMVARVTFEAIGGNSARVTMNLVPFVFGDITSRTLQISSSKETVEVSLSEGINTVELALDGASRQTIDFFCPRLDSPQSLGLSEDPRSLCAKLLNFSVLSD